MKRHSYPLVAPFILGTALLIACSANQDLSRDTPLSSVGQRAELVPRRPGGTGSCQLFVATYGDDANPGTETSPFATLERARDAIRVRKAGATAPISVCLRGGTYELAHPFTLGPGDSGTATAPINYGSYPGEHATLSGGTRIHPAWSHYTGDIYVAPMRLSFNQLVVDGERAIRARSPNGDASYHLTGLSTGNSPSSFLYQAGTLPAGLNHSDIEIVSMELFMSPRQKVASTDATTVTTEGLIWPQFPYGSDYAHDDRYYVENSLDALDSPGEWYLDETAHKLYYWPHDPAEIRSGEFVVPRLHQLVRGGSYPENTGYADVWSSVVPPGCRHIGIYPQSSDALSFGHDSFTVASWLRLPLGKADPFWVFTKGDPVGAAATGVGGNGYGLSTNATTGTVPVEFFVNDGTHRYSASVGAQPRGQWIHLAFVVDRAVRSIRSYVGGTLAGTQDISALGSIESRLPLDLGAYTNTGCSSSAVDDFRVYASALSPTEVAALAAGTPPTADAALWLPLDGDFDDHSPLRSETVPFLAPQFISGVNGAEAADFSSSFPADASGSVDYVGFSELGFEQADWVLPYTGQPGTAAIWTSPAAVYLHSRHATLVGNRFRHLGSHALGGMLASSVVADNEFSDIGGCAVQIGQSANTQAEQLALVEFTSNDTITGNRVRDVGVVDRDALALWINQGANNIISRNVIENAPYMGIVEASVQAGISTLSDGNNRIFLNRVDHVMQLLNDGGGIYVDAHQPGTVIERNVVHDVLETPAHLTNFGIEGIYLDGGSNGFLVRDNLTYRIEYANIFLNSATYGNGNNAVRNNIFVDGNEYQLGLDSASADSFHHNIVYYARNPNAVLFYSSSPSAIGSSDYNLFYSPTAPGFASQLAAWRTLGFDPHSSALDPQFVDYAHDDFALEPSSPALQPVGSGGIGFQAIDFTGLP
jgi:hypothetical protein